MKNVMAEFEPHYRRNAAGNLPEPVRRPIHVVLDNIRSAYNVGSFFRTADAAGAEHLHLCGLTAYPPNEKLSKTALGAMDYVPWTYYENTEAAVEQLQRRKIPLIALETRRDAESYLDFDWPQPVALILGHEVDGVSESVLAVCNRVVSIPMYGYKNSINVATAFGVVLFEIARRWDAALTGKTVR